MALHSALTTSNLHEPKDASTATSGQVYVFDGAGSGSPTTINNQNVVHISTTIPDISTAGSYWIVPGIAGDITAIHSVIDGAITGADCGLTFEISGTAITSSAITITQAGSAAGDVDSSTPSAANTITAAQAVELITDGASSTTVRATITLTIDVS